MRIWSEEENECGFEFEFEFKSESQIRIPMAEYFRVCERNRDEFDDFSSIRRLIDSKRKRQWPYLNSGPRFGSQKWARESEPTLGNSPTSLCHWTLKFGAQFPPIQLISLPIELYRSWEISSGREWNSLIISWASSQLDRQSDGRKSRFMCRWIVAEQRQREREGEREGEREERDSPQCKICTHTACSQTNACKIACSMYCTALRGTLAAWAQGWPL